MARKTMEEKILTILEELTLMEYKELKIDNTDMDIYRIYYNSYTKVVTMRINIYSKYIIIRDHYRPNIQVYGMAPSIYNSMVKNIVEYIEDNFKNYEVLISRRTAVKKTIRFNSDNAKKFHMEYKLINKGGNN